MANETIGRMLRGVVANTNTCIEVRPIDGHNLAYYRVDDMGLVYGKPVPTKGMPADRGDGFPNSFMDGAADVENLRLIGGIGTHDRWIVFHQGNPLLSRDGTRLRIADTDERRVIITEEDGPIAEVSLTPLKGNEAQAVAEHLIHGARSAFLPLGVNDMEGISFGTDQRFLLIFSENVEQGALGELFGARMSGNFWEGVTVERDPYFVADADGADVGKAMMFALLKGKRCLAWRQLNHGRKGPLQYITTFEMCTVPIAHGAEPFERLDAAQVLELGCADFTRLVPTIVPHSNTLQLQLPLSLSM